VTTTASPLAPARYQRAGALAWGAVRQTQRHAIVFAVADNIEKVLYARTALKSGWARTLREQLHLGRPALAQQLGIAASTLADWETGRRNPSDNNAARYGALLRQLENQTVPTPPKEHTP